MAVAPVLCYREPSWTPRPPCTHNPIVSIATAVLVIELPPSPGRRFLGMIIRPRATLAGLTEADAWLWPAVMLLTGYIVYYLPIGLGTGDVFGTMLESLFKDTANADRSSAATARFLMGFMPSSMVSVALWLAPLLAALSWALRSAVFYTLARWLGGDKPFWGRVVSMVGWAWVPLLFQYLALGVTLLVAPEVFGFFVASPDLTGAANPMAANQQKWQAQLMIELSPFVLWNLGLCVIGVAEVFRLPRWKSAIVVLAPTVAQILFQVLMYVASQSALGRVTEIATPR